MFTGLIKKLSKVKHISDLENGLEIRFENPFDDLELGDSISINGVCSTVVNFDKSYFDVQYLEETLKKTSMGDLNIDDVVNMEPSATLATKMGGHFVQGHVDTRGQIKSIEKADPWGVLVVSFDQTFDSSVVEKGSICIDGISLTVVDVGHGYCSCHIIPHTFEHTVLQFRKSGDNVNIEFDVLSKYIQKYMDTKYGDINDKK